MLFKQLFACFCTEKIYLLPESNCFSLIFRSCYIYIKNKETKQQKKASYWYISWIFVVRPSLKAKNNELIFWKTEYNVNMKNNFIMHKHFKKH